MSRVAVTAVSAVAALAMLSGCGGSDDARTKSSRADRPKSGDAERPDTPQKLGEMRGAVAIDAPKAFEPLSGSFLLAGRASVEKGVLAWTIERGRSRVLARGSMRASCAAPCVGTYKQPIPLAKVPEGSWELHVFAPGGPNPNSRRHDTMIPITVTRHPVEGAPAVDAPPPGGVPEDR